MKKRRGGQAVELALLMPILLGLTSSIIDYGWYFYIQNQFSQVVRDSARAAIILDNQTSEMTPCQLFNQNLNNGLSQVGYSNQSLTVSTQIVNDGSKRLLVEVSDNYHPLFGLITTPETLSVKTIYRLEDQNWEGC